MKIRAWFTASLNHLRKQIRGDDSSTRWGLVQWLSSSASVAKHFLWRTFFFFGGSKCCDWRTAAAGFPFFLLFFFFGNKIFISFRERPRVCVCWFGPDILTVAEWGLTDFRTPQGRLSGATSEVAIKHSDELSSLRLKCFGYQSRRRFEHFIQIKINERFSYF